MKHRHRAVLSVLRSVSNLSVQEIIVAVEAANAIPLTGNETLIALNDLEDWGLVVETDGVYEMKEK